MEKGPDDGIFSICTQFMAVGLVHPAANGRHFDNLAVDNFWSQGKRQLSLGFEFNAKMSPFKKSIAKYRYRSALNLSNVLVRHVSKKLPASFVVFFLSWRYAPPKPIKAKKYSFWKFASELFLADMQNSLATFFWQTDNEQVFDVLILLLVFFVAVFDP